MNTNQATDADKPRPTHAKLNEVRLDAPRTIPSSWDVSEMLNGKSPSRNGNRSGKNGSHPAPEQQEETPAARGRGSRVISELPESDFPEFFFKPY